VTICMVTTSQPSGNPRLVKEADALVAVGHDVHIVAAFQSTWAHEFDRSLADSRGWTLEILDWRRAVNPALFWRSRIRHFAARTSAGIPGLRRLAQDAAISRVGPDLKPLVLKRRADLFIAHNLGALPVALSAGRRNDVPVGFDAEDFHSGQLSQSRDGVQHNTTVAAERRLLPLCTYVTAASPLIADSYRELCHIDAPTCILNVFPLRDRPPAFRPSDPDERLRLHWFSQTIGPDRGLEQVVIALGRMNRPDVELHLRGRWHPGYEETLRDLAQRSGLQMDRLFAHAPAHPDELVRLSADYDIGLALEPAVSRNNDIALSNKIFTYLLAGNAIIATSTRAQAGIAPSLGRSIALCEPVSADGLSAALRPWLDDRGSLRAAREEAWQLGEHRYNWDVESRRFLDVIARVTASAPAPVA
jgi:glycosyltransferase involved in cell wall biosynthesis